MSDAQGSTDALIDALIDVDATLRPRRGAVRVVRAPGRVNLIGEYTDFNLGLVLPAAIDLEVRIAYVPTDDRRVTLTRLDDGVSETFDLDTPQVRSGSFIDYVAGTAWALEAAGHAMTGLRGVIGSTLPSGAGLSSSAAIELASAWALMDETAPDVDPMTLARICQLAENEYVGVHSGLMDQFAEACGVAGAALLLDCRSLEWRSVPLPSDVALVVCHTGAPRRLDGSAYNERRAECDRAVAVIAADDPSVRSLRDVTLQHLAEAGDRLDPVARRRAEHVVLENERVATVVAALEVGDMATVGAAFAACHASLRDRFEVSSPGLDTMVEIAAGVPGVLATRMTGAGFGGCTVALVRPDAVAALRAAVERDYPARTGLRPMVLPVQAAAGASRVA